MPCAAPELYAHPAAWQTQVRVSAEVYPLDLCDAITTCQLDGESGHFDIPATGRAPFGTWGMEESEPQLRECFVDCRLLRPGLKLETVHLRWELSHAKMAPSRCSLATNTAAAKSPSKDAKPICCNLVCCTAVRVHCRVQAP